jgi:hypothetical protein
MGKLITAKIDVKKIVKALLFEGKKGTYLDLIIWINDKPDQFGNDISIQQRTKKGDPVIYIGEGKFYVKKESAPLENKEGQFQKSGKVQTGAMSDVNELPGANDDSLPF